MKILLACALIAYPCAADTPTSTRNPIGPRQNQAQTSNHTDIERELRETLIKIAVKKTEMGELKANHFSLSAQIGGGIFVAVGAAVFGAYTWDDFRNKHRTCPMSDLHGPNGAISALVGFTSGAISSVSHLVFNRSNSEKWKILRREVKALEVRLVGIEQRLRRAGMTSADLEILYFRLNGGDPLWNKRPQF